MLGIILGFTISSLCFVHLLAAGRDGLAREVDREPYNLLAKDACTPVDTHLSDMTLSIIKSIKNSSTAFSAVLNASEIRTQGKQFVVSENISDTVMR
jgi:hypothetical protein